MNTTTINPIVSNPIVTVNLENCSAIAKALNSNLTTKKGKVITKDQVDEVTLKEWKSAVKSFQQSLYVAAQRTHDYAVLGNKYESLRKELDLEAAYSIAKTLVSMIGTVSGHSIATNSFVPFCVQMAIKVKNEPIGEHALAIDTRDNAKKLLSKYSNVSGINEKFIDEQQEIYDEYAAKVEKYATTEGYTLKKYTEVTPESFRASVEHFLAECISGQLAKTPEEIAEAKRAKKAAAKQRAKARKESNIK